MVVTVSATGNLEPVNEVQVGSEVSGTIRSVNVDYNDQVKAGQVLAELDTTKLNAQVLQYKAALASAQANLLDKQAKVFEAKNKLERLRKTWELSKGRAPSEQDIEAAEAALKSAEAQEAVTRADIEKSRAILEAAQSDLGKAVIRSPIDGVVMTRSIDVGQTVTANYQTPEFFTLAEDLKKMRLVVDVDEADVGQVKEGQTATFTVDAYPDRSFPAVITQVRYASTTTSNVVTYETLLEVDNSDMLLRPGMTATADIEVSKATDALIVPNAAFRFSPPSEEGAQPEVSGGGRSPLISSLMPRRPRARNIPGKSVGTTRTAGRLNENIRNQRVFVLKDGQLVPIMLKTGMTDGVNTAVIAGEIEEGTQLVTEAVRSKS